MTRWGHPRKPGSTPAAPPDPRSSTMLPVPSAKHDMPQPPSRRLHGRTGPSHGRYGTLPRPTGVLWPSDVRRGAARAPRPIPDRSRAASVQGRSPNRLVLTDLQTHRITEEQSRGSKTYALAGFQWGGASREMSLGVGLYRISYA